MRIKKTVWTFFMIIMAAMLVLIINSRVQLTSEVVDAPFLLSSDAFSLNSCC